MKAKCPNDCAKKRFYVTAHVAQTWQVDEDGHWCGTMCTDETTHAPDADDIWTCITCDAEAEVSR